MKRAILIAGGTVGGLGAVLSITPPQLESNGSLGLSVASATTSLPVGSVSTAATSNSNQSNVASATTTPLPKTTVTKKSIKKKTTHAIASSDKVVSSVQISSTDSTNSSSSQSSTNATSERQTTSTSSNNNVNSKSGTSSKSVSTSTDTKQPQIPTSANKPEVSGSFTGDVINVGYGLVQVKITVSNGRITDAIAIQAPNGRSQRFTDYAVPNLRQQTLSEQSANIQGVSGASYTSYGWYKSLISALQRAGMKTGV